MANSKGDIVRMLSISQLLNSSKKSEGNIILQFKLRMDLKFQKGSKTMMRTYLVELELFDCKHKRKKLENKGANGFHVSW